MEAIENVVVCHDDEPRGALPRVQPTNFSVVLGAVLAGETERELREGLEALGGLEAGYAVLLNVLEWVESVFERCREDQGRLRGQVMALGAAILWPRDSRCFLTDLD